jgi:protocatechuate 3,4-dioxygenase beta subunit
MSTLAAVAGCGSSGTTATTTATASETTATTTTLTASSTAVTEGVSITLTATVSPSAATGTVTFYDGTTALGSGTLTSGVATLATTFSATGAQALTATYTGATAYAASTSASLSVTVTASTTASCSASLEGEEGPYFVDDSASGYLRSNILSNLDGSETQTGVPLALTIYVYDSKNGCVAMQNVQVDIWSCNASGVYSAESSESTTGQSWLRGYQLTDANGMIQFTTIIPGWYAGRTNHIHLRFRSTYDSTDTSGSNTMQLFFDQTLIDTLATSVTPYSQEGTDSTTNASDRVYTTEEDGTTLLTLSGSTSAGYTATFKAYMPIAS